MPEENVQHNPQKGLRDQIATDTRPYEGPDWTPGPAGIANDNQAFRDDRDEKS
jgi:hypothetical protein